MATSKWGNVAYAYVISHRELNLYIGVLNISCLHLHEETIPSLLNRLVRSIRAMGCVKHPVVADGNSLVVLDGIHRVAALERLRCKRVPVCLVDYRNPAIDVGCWYRTVKGAMLSEDTIAHIRQVGDVVKVTEVNEKLIGTQPTVAAIKDRKKAFYIQSPFEDLRGAYDIVRRIEEKLRKLRLRIGYETESDALRRLWQMKADAVVFTPRLTKDSIIRTALSGRVFSHKATRHIIPARPLHVNVPLSLLIDDGRNLQEINGELKAMLEKRRVEHIAAGSVHERRRYEEDLYLFVDSSA